MEAGGVTANTVDREDGLHVYLRKMRRVRMCVCVCERERERESVCVFVLMRLKKMSRQMR